MKLIEYKDLENGDEYWIIKDGKPCWTVFDENSSYSQYCFTSEQECIDFIKETLDSHSNDCECDICAEYNK